MVVTPGLSTKSYKQLGGRSTIFVMPKELTLSHRSPGMLETCCQTKPFKTPPLKTSWTKQTKKVKQFLKEQNLVFVKMVYLVCYQGYKVDLDHSTYWNSVYPCSRSKNACTRNPTLQYIHFTTKLAFLRKVNSLTLESAWSKSSGAAMVSEVEGPFWNSNLFPVPSESNWSWVLPVQIKAGSTK